LYNWSQSRILIKKSKYNNHSIKSFAELFLNKERGEVKIIEIGGRGGVE
jgi:hypothetical protein